MNRRVVRKIDSKAKATHRCAGLSLIEVLIALAIAALLLLATAVAFDGAFKSYKANHDMAMSSMTARNSLYQICSTLRSAWNDPHYDIGGDDTDDRGIYVNDDGTECSLIDSSGREVIYRYDATEQQLQVNLDNGAKWYVFINNVQPVTADMPIFAATELVDLEGFNPGTISRVDINFRVLEDKTSRAVSAAVVPRNVVYAAVD